MGLAAGGNGNSRYDSEWNDNETQQSLGTGMGMGMNSWEWEGMRLKKTESEFSSVHFAVEAESLFSLWKAEMMQALCGQLHTVTVDNCI